MMITDRPGTFTRPLPTSTGRPEPLAPGSASLLIIALNAFAWHVDKTGNHPYRLLGLGIFMAGLLWAVLLFAFACIVGCLVHIDWNTSPGGRPMEPGGGSPV